MKNFGRNFALIGILTLVGLLAIWPPDEKLKLGIDLSGGTILVYQAKDDASGKEVNMDDLISALKRRVNPEGVLDIPIRKVGSNRVEIILPEANPEEVDEVKRRITQVGSMEFRILADRRDPTDQSAIDRALRERSSTTDRAPRGYRWASLGETIQRQKPESGKRGLANWVRLEGDRLIDPIQSWTRDKYVGARLQIVQNDADGKPARSYTFPVLSNDSNSLLVDPARAEVFEAGKVVTTNLGGTLAAKVKTVDSYALVLNPSRIEGENLAIREVDRGTGITEREVLYKDDRYDVTGEYLANVYPTQDERVQPAVGFVFNARGANKFRKLTREHAPREDGNFLYHLAILLDDVVMSAPVIRQEIGEQGIIENMQPKQVDELINILRAGSLPASIDPIPLQEEKIGPTLGKDTIQKGVRAIFFSMLAVPLFMIAYYRFAGVVAVIAFILNMILLIGSMAFTGSSFTLPGLAGLSLTIGMAVDANVLIFERMREEAERGANLGTQIRNGFSRAWTTILDSNVTTMLSGMVLWWIGTEEIKGFALTLIIGLIWNLFTAVYVSRVIFEFAYQKGWIKRLSMGRIKGLGHTNINFVGPRLYFQLGSLAVILVGLAVFAAQKGNNFNIDFTGGTLVTIQLDPADPAISGLNESQRSSFVREQATEAKLPDVSIESLNVEGENRGTRFNVRTTLTDSDAVQRQIRQQFGPALARLTVEVTKSEAIPEPPKDDEAGAAVAQRFSGGRAYTLTFNRSVKVEPVRAALSRIFREMKIPSPDSKFEVEEVKPSDEETAAKPQLVVRTSLSETQMDAALADLSRELPNDPNLLFERLEKFGAAVARDTQTLAIIAIVASWLVMIGYLWLRFKSVSYGLAAVIALVHDVLITLGAVAISPYKIDLPMVAAFLTLIGFSVNDTIVIFDRIREIKGKSPVLTEGIVNAAINQTLSRTILTSLTAWLVVVILYVFGGEGLHGFSFCLVVGFVTGTYSTIYIASPVLVDWAKWGEKKTKGQAKPEAVGSRS